MEHVIQRHSFAKLLTFATEEIQRHSNSCKLHTNWCYKNERRVYKVKNLLEVAALTCHCYQEEDDCKLSRGLSVERVIDKIRHVCSKSPVIWAVLEQVPHRHCGMTESAHAHICSNFKQAKKSIWLAHPAEFITNWARPKPMSKSLNRQGGTRPSRNLFLFLTNITMPEISGTSKDDIIHPFPHAKSFTHHTINTGSKSRRMS